MQEENLVFERLSEKHLPEALEIEKESFKDPWSREMFRLELVNSDSYGVVLLTAGQVSGFGIMRFVGGDEAHILDLAVRLGKRRLGLGEKLLTHLLEKGGQLSTEKFFLEVRTGNTAAISLYKKHGFTIIRIRKGYYNDGDDAYEMSKG